MLDEFTNFKLGQVEEMYLRRDGRVYTQDKAFALAFYEIISNA